jgi:hypothetical protein
MHIVRETSDSYFIICTKNTNLQKIKTNLNYAFSAKALKLEYHNNKKSNIITTFILKHVVRHEFQLFFKRFYLTRKPFLTS